MSSGSAAAAPLSKSDGGVVSSTSEAPQHLLSPDVASPLEMVEKFFKKLGDLAVEHNALRAIAEGRRCTGEPDFGHDFYAHFCTSLNDLSADDSFESAALDFQFIQQRLFVNTEKMLEFLDQLQDAGARALERAEEALREAGNEQRSRNLLKSEGLVRGSCSAVAYCLESADHITRQEEGGRVEECVARAEEHLQTIFFRISVFEHAQRRLIKPLEDLLKYSRLPSTNEPSFPEQSLLQQLLSHNELNALLQQLLSHVDELAGRLKRASTILDTTPLKTVTADDLRDAAQALEDADIALKFTIHGDLNTGRGGDLHGQSFDEARPGIQFRKWPETNITEWKEKLFRRDRPCRCCECLAVPEKYVAEVRKSLCPLYEEVWAHAMKLTASVRVSLSTITTSVFESMPFATLGRESSPFTHSAHCVPRDNCLLHPPTPMYRGTRPDRFTMTGLLFQEFLAVRKKKYDPVQEQTLHEMCGVSVEELIKKTPCNIIDHGGLLGLRNRNGVRSLSFVDRYGGMDVIPAAVSLRLEIRGRSYFPGTVQAEACFYGRRTDGRPPDGGNSNSDCGSKDVGTLDRKISCGGNEDVGMLGGGMEEADEKCYIRTDVVSNSKDGGKKNLLVKLPDDETVSNLLFLQYSFPTFTKLRER